MNCFNIIFIFKSFAHFRLVPHDKQAKENVMHYREMVEQGTRDTHDQIKAKEEEINTKTFKSGKYATLCRGDTSQVPVILGLCRRIGKVFQTHSEFTQYLFSSHLSCRVNITEAIRDGKWASRNIFRHIFFKRKAVSLGNQVFS